MFSEGNRTGIVIEGTPCDIRSAPMLDFRPYAVSFIRELAA